MNVGLAWEPSAMAWAAVAAAIVAAVLSARQYARVAARGPAVLRGVTLGLLAVTALRPTVRYPEPAVARRPVRVVIDDSLSMAVTDGGRSPGRRLRLAAALGLFDDSALPRPTRDADALRRRLADLRRAGDALAVARRTDPAAAADRARANAARDAAMLAVQDLVASARRAGCSAVTLDTLRQAEPPLIDAADPAPMTAALENTAGDLQQRADEAYERAAADPAALDVVDRLGRATRFDTAVAAAKRLRGEVPNGVTSVALDGRAVPLTGGDKPAAAATPLTAALRDACGRAAADGDDAVVLLSDGRSTEPRSLLAVAAAAGVAVYPVGVAPDDHAPDVRVIRVGVRSAVLAGQPVLVRVRLGQRNAAGRTARLVVTDGRREVARSVTLGNDNTYDLTWPDARPPRVTLTARVDPLDGETRLQNNAASVDASVFDRRARVTVVSGDLSRDAAELQDALTAATWADVRSIALDPARPVDAAFDDAELIVLADVPGDGLSESAWAALDRGVRANGASLVVLAGQGDWLTDPAVARHLAPLLPTTNGPPPAWTPPTQRVWPVPTRFGIDTPALRLDESADATVRAWLGRPRPSRLLAVGPPRPEARVLLADRAGGAPVIVESAAGAGRVTLVLTDEAWRWSTPDAPDAARRFWQDVAQGDVDLPYDVSAGGLSLAPDAADAVAGRPVGVRARTADPAAGPATLSITRGGAAVAAPPLRELLPGGGRWAGPLNLPAGTYDLAWRQGRRSVETTLVVKPDTQQELADTTPDPALLQRIADATGGVALPADEIDRLPGLLAARRERERRTAAYALWCGPPWFALIVACLGLEWALRPRAGLP